SIIAVDSYEPCITTTTTTTMTATCTTTPTPNLSCPKNHQKRNGNKHHRNKKEIITCTLTETTCITPAPTCVPSGGPCIVENFTSCCMGPLGGEGCQFTPPNPI
ncbi:1098_t:CDS:1, partial [Cetraspora pellucida]